MVRIIEYINKKKCVRNAGGEAVESAGGEEDDGK